MINLGISYTGIHDSSCCIIIDERLVYAISEERLTRKKHDSSFPVNAIKSAFDYCNIKPNEIDNVVLDWSHPLFCCRSVQVRHYDQRQLLAGDDSSPIKTWTQACLGQG